MGDPINNALSNYDNQVAPGKKSGGGLLGKLKELSSGGIEGLTSSVSSFLGKDIKKLNELANGLKGFSLPGFLKGLMGKFEGLLKGLIKNGLATLMDLKDDLLRKLLNAATSFFSNTLEDFVHNIRSVMFVPDELYEKTLRGLYYSGADLAYDDHYIRNTCLERDLCESLKFVDSEYPINYTHGYRDLEKDLNTCTNNSCWKNTHYIFGKIYNERKSLVAENNSIKTRLDSFIVENALKSQEYIELNKKYTINKEKISYIENLMLDKLRSLIINSYTYLTANNLLSFFESYPDVLKPKYYGYTDDKYGNKYCFSTSDLLVMMPYYEKSKKSSTDHAVQELENRDNRNLFEKSKELKRYAVDKFDSFRANLLNRQAKRSSNLYDTAVTTGTTGVYKSSKSRYKRTKNNKVVKYRDPNISTILRDVMVDETKYIELRNKNIKHIYVLMSSKIIFDNDRMVNENFYNRCKIKTKNSLNENLDKATGILGTSYAVQSLFDLSDAIDSSGWKYTKKIEKYLFNPKSNVTVKELGNIIEEDFNSFEIDEDSPSKGITKPPKNGLNNAISGSNVGTNSTVAGYLDLLMKKPENIEKRKELANIMRFSSSIPMIVKRDIIIKHLTHFYENMKTRKIPKDEIKSIFAKLCVNVFGRDNIISPDKLDLVFDKSTKDSLTQNISTIICIDLTNSTESMLGILSHPNKELISNLYKITVSLFSKEIAFVGFSKSISRYDKDYLKSLVKQMFYYQIDHLKDINDRSNKFFSQFFNLKDKLTLRYSGFDRNGIIGYNEEFDKIQYTNIEIGDWNAILYSKRGTYFLGHDQTKNNGIKIYKSNSNSIENTNIIHGNWINGYNYLENLFFENSNHELYYINNKNRIVKTNAPNIEKYEFIFIPEFKIILLSGLEDNGVYIWKNNKFDQIVSNGGNYKYLTTKVENNGVLFFYSKDIPSPVFTINRSFKFNIVTTEKRMYTHFIEIENKIKYQISEIGGGTSNPQLTDKTINEYRLVSGTNNGIYNFISSFTEVSNKPNPNIYPNEFKEYKDTKHITDTYIIKLEEYSGVLLKKVEDRKYKSYSIKYNESITVENVLNENEIIPNLEDKYNSICNEDMIEDAFTVSEKNKDYNVIECDDSGIYFTATKYVDPSLGGKSIKELIHRYDSFIEYNSEDTITNSETGDISNISDILNESKLYRINDDKTMFISDKNILYIDKTNKRVKNIFDIPTFNNNNNVEGWKIKEIGDYCFLINNLKEKGILQLNYKDTDISLKKCGVDSGKWQICEGGKYLYLLSIDGANNGIRYSLKNNNLTFIHFDDLSKKDNGDYYGFSYEPDKKFVFIGNCREKVTINIKEIAKRYDLDEFIYLLNEYQMQQLLLYMIDVNLTTLMESITQLIADGTDINEILRLLNSIMSKMKDFIESIQTGSNLFKDLLIYSETKELFDLDDDETIDKMMLDMLSHSIGSPNNTDRQNRLFIKMLSKKIQYTFNRDVVEKDPNTGKYVTVLTPQYNEINSKNPEWNIRYNSMSDDFMNEIPD